MMLQQLVHSVIQCRQARVEKGDSEMLATVKNILRKCDIELMIYLEFFNKTLLYAIKDFGINSLVIEFTSFCFDC